MAKFKVTYVGPGKGKFAQAGHKPSLVIELPKNKGVIVDTAAYMDEKDKAFVRDYIDHWRKHYMFNVEDVEDDAPIEDVTVAPRDMKKRSYKPVEKEEKPKERKRVFRKSRKAK